MSTTQRLGIDIVGTDRTRAGFASAQRSMAGLNRSANQLKLAFGGLVGGNVMAAFIRSLISVNKAEPAVKKSFENLSTAWRGFALKAGDAGLNAALINFANRIGSLVIGTDGLSRSIGAFLGGTINVMAGIFEGIGRAIGFVYDNLGFFARGLAAIAFVEVAAQLIALSRGFVLFISTLRAAGLATAIFTLIQRRMLLLWAAIIAVGAKVTGTFEKLTEVLNQAFEAGDELLPVIGDSVVAGLNQMGFNVKSLTSAFGDYERQLAMVPAVTDGATASTDKLGKATKLLKGGLTEVSPAMQTLQQVGQVFASGFGQAFNSVIEGTMSVKKAFMSMAKSILQNLASMATNKLFSGLFSKLLGGFMGGGGGLMASFNGLYAKGGTIPAGRWGILGENGPEPVMGPGTVLPNSSLRGGGGGRRGPQAVNININLSGANGNAEVARIARQSVKEGLLEYQRLQPQAELERGLRLS
jgi:hypothetical protein